MVCLGVKPGVAGWKAQTNPLSYGGTPITSFLPLKSFGHYFNLVATVKLFNCVHILFQWCFVKSIQPNLTWLTIGSIFADLSLLIYQRFITSFLPFKIIWALFYVSGHS